MYRLFAPVALLILLTFASTPDTELALNAALGRDDSLRVTGDAGSFASPCRRAAGCIEHDQRACADVLKQRGVTAVDQVDARNGPYRDAASRDFGQSVAPGPSTSAVSC